MCRIKKVPLIWTKDKNTSTYKFTDNLQEKHFENKEKKKLANLSMENWYKWYCSDWDNKSVIVCLCVCQCEWGPVSMGMFSVQKSWSLINFFSLSHFFSSIFPNRNQWTDLCCLNFSHLYRFLYSIYLYITFGFLVDNFLRNKKHWMPKQSVVLIGCQYLATNIFFRKFDLVCYHSLCFSFVQEQLAFPFVSMRISLEFCIV